MWMVVSVVMGMVIFYVYAYVLYVGFFTIASAVGMAALMLNSSPPLLPPDEQVWWYWGWIGGVALIGLLIDWRRAQGRARAAFEAQAQYEAAMARRVSQINQP